MHPEEILKDKFGLAVPEPPQPKGAYVPAVQSGSLVYVSGQLPIRKGEVAFTGRLGDDLNVEQGQNAARLAALNCLAAVKGVIGDLERVRRVVQVTGYIRSAEGFAGQAAVLNGASLLFGTIFGDRGAHSRLAVGVSELPLGAAVEVSCVVEVSS